MSQTLKEKAAEAVLSYLDDVRVIGVGTGSTVNCFIQALAKIKNRIDATIPSSHATAERLKALGFPVLSLNSVDEIPVYVDGADEVNLQRQLIKGGGGALTQEKIIASAAQQFICIVDESKVVYQFSFPVAVEVLPMARSFVAREIVNLGGSPAYRQGFTTDNGHIILDVMDLPFDTNSQLETSLNVIPGVVENGIFCQRLADIILVANQEGIDVIKGS